MSFAQRCFREFTPADRRRGESYFHGGRCRLRAVDGRRAWARVAGSRGIPYQVALDWTSAEVGLLAAACECPRFANGFLCKHLWATLLALDGAGHGRRLPGSGSLGMVLEPPLVRFAPADPERVEAPRPAGRTREDWRRQLDGIRGALEQRTGGAPLLERRREAWYLLDLPACRESGRLTLDLHQRAEKKSGGMGKIKSLSVAEDEIDRFSDPRDRRALSLLLAATPPRPELRSRHWFENDRPARQGKAMVPAALYEAVLPPLCATGRFVAPDGRRDDSSAATPLAWDDGPPWRLALRLELSGEGEPALLTGELARGDERRRLDEPRLLLADGLVVFPEVVARLDAEADFPWIYGLRRDGEIRVPAGQLEPFLRQLAALPVLPELALPPQLELEEVRLPPRPAIAFRFPRGRSGAVFIEARAGFDYDGREVVAGSGPATLLDLERRRLLPRDAAAEAAALARLGELGLRPAGGTRDAWPLELPAPALPGAVEALLAAGWEVRAEGRPVRRAGNLQLRVSSGVDWFDLAGGADFGGEPAPLPRLLEALRTGERWVRLDDGSEGLLPAEWLTRFGPLGALAEEDEEGGLHLLRSQALLLDALLAEAEAEGETEAAEIDLDAGFARFRERLAGFAGVAPEPEPRGFQGALRPYQREGLGWLLFLQEMGLGGCLADDMGLGKTVQVLALFQHRRLHPPPEGGRRPHLVVAPRSLVYNWLDEAHRFTPRLEVLDYTGPGRASLRRRFGEVDVVVTTYGTLRRDAAQVRELELDYAVLDEAQAIKNPDSQAAKACRLIRARHRLALTGTPIENHLGELWSIFEFLNPGMLGRLPRFAGRGGGDGLDEESLAALSHALRPVILRRTKEQVLTDLPEKTEQTLLCQLSRRERQLYDELRLHYRERLNRRIGEVGLARSKIQVLEALLRLRQAACHPALLDRGRADEDSAKLATLLTQLEEILEEGHKALVFSQFVKLLTLVRQRLDERGIPYEYLDGRTRKRKERVERFQNDPDCPLFLISLKAGGLGLNLTAADYVFLLDPWWNPAVEAQAVDRAHRIGQSRPVFAYRLIARDTVEEKIQALQESKRELAEAILSADKSAIRALTPEDLELLLS